MVYKVFSSSVLYREELSVWIGQFRYKALPDNCQTAEQAKSVKPISKQFSLTKYDGEKIPTPTAKRPNQGKKTAEKALDKRIKEFIAALEEDDLAAQRKADRERMKLSESAWASATVPEYMAHFVDELEDGTRGDGGRKLTASTIASYRGYVRNYYAVSSVLKNKRVCDLTKDDASAFRKQLAKWKSPNTGKPITGNTAKKVFELIHHAYRNAVQYDLIDADPFYNIHAPSVEHQKPNSLTESEYIRLCAKLDSLQPETYDERRFIVAVEIALQTGMRRGEICGLDWKHVHIEGEQGYIQVRQTIARKSAVKGVRGEDNYIKPTAKSKAGNRDIPLSPDLIEVLRDWKAYQLLHMKEFRGRQSGKTFVVGDVNGNYMRPDGLSTQWAKHNRLDGWGFIGTEDKPVTFHGLRHTFVTIEIASGIDPVTVAKLAGHEDTKMTLDVYADTTAQRKQSAIAATAAALRPHPKPAPVIQFSNAAADDESGIAEEPRLVISEDAPTMGYEEAMYNAAAYGQLSDSYRGIASRAKTEKERIIAEAKAEAFRTVSDNFKDEAKRSGRNG